MSRRLVALACVLWMVAAVAVVFGAGRARAAAPRDQGWWTALSVAPPAGTPTPPVALPTGIPSAPTAPDVPARGLLVQGGPNAPTAYSALLYELDEGVTASTLTLAVAPNTLTNPQATLQVCRLLQPINHPEDGGPLTDGPPYDCSRNATAAATANTYKFEVGGLVADKVLAVAILPTAPTDRVVFSPPDDNSLATQGGSATGSDVGSGVGDAGAVGPSDSVPAVGSDIAGSSAPVGGGLSIDSTPAAPVVDPTIATPAGPPAVAPSGQASNLPFEPAATGAPEKATPLAVVLLVAGAIGGTLLWAFAGRPRARAALP